MNTILKADGKLILYDGKFLQKPVVKTPVEKILNASATHQVNVYPESNEIVTQIIVPMVTKSDVHGESQIQPSDLKSGVTILGITGTLASDDSDLDDILTRSYGSEE